MEGRPPLTRRLACVIFEVLEPGRDGEAVFVPSANRIPPLLGVTTRSKGQLQLSSDRAQRLRRLPRPLDDPGRGAGRRRPKRTGREPTARPAIEQLKLLRARAAPKCDGREKHGPMKHGSWSEHSSEPPPVTPPRASASIRIDVARILLLQVGALGARWSEVQGAFGVVFFLHTVVLSSHRSGFEQQLGAALAAPDLAGVAAGWRHAGMCSRGGTWGVAARLGHSFTARRAALPPVAASGCEPVHQVARLARAAPSSVSSGHRTVLFDVRSRPRRERARFLHTGRASEGAGAAARRAGRRWSCRRRRQRACVCGVALGIGSPSRDRSVWSKRRCSTAARPSASQLPACSH